MLTGPYWTSPHMLLLGTARKALEQLETQHTVLFPHDSWMQSFGQTGYTNHDSLATRSSPRAEQDFRTLTSSNWSPSDGQTGWPLRDEGPCPGVLASALPTLCLSRCSAQELEIDHKSFHHIGEAVLHIGPEGSHWSANQTVPFSHLKSFGASPLPVEWSSSLLSWKTKPSMALHGPVYFPRLTFCCPVPLLAEFPVYSYSMFFVLLFMLCPQLGICFLHFLNSVTLIYPSRSSHNLFSPGQLPRIPRQG